MKPTVFVAGEEGWAWESLRGSDDKKRRTPNQEAFTCSHKHVVGGLVPL